MQAIGKLFFVFILVACYVSTIDAKSNTEKDTVVDDLKENLVEGATNIKDTVSNGVKIGAKMVVEAAKVGSEYAEVLTEKAANAAETGNEYLAQGADIVKEYAT
jgi:hypothetical protein